MTMATSNLTYCDWRSGQSRRGLISPPLPHNHVAYGAECLLCHEPMVDKPVQIIAVGLMGDEDPSVVSAAKRGETFWAGAILVDAPCAAELTDHELEIFTSSLGVAENLR